MLLPVHLDHSIVVSSPGYDSVVTSSGSWRSCQHTWIRHCCYFIWFMALLSAHLDQWCFGYMWTIVFSDFIIMGHSVVTSCDTWRCLDFMQTRQLSRPHLIVWTSRRKRRCRQSIGTRTVPRVCHAPPVACAVCTSTKAVRVISVGRE